MTTDRENQRRAEIARYGYRNAGKPEEGFFAVRLRKGAIEVGARIEFRASRDPETGELLDRSPVWFVTIDGEPDPDPRGIPGERVWRVWHSGRRIEEPEYRYLLARTTWAVHHDPASPEARPDEPLDPLTCKPPF